MLSGCWMSDDVVCVCLLLYTVCVYKCAFWRVLSVFVCPGFLFTLCRALFMYRLGGCSSTLTGLLSPPLLHTSFPSSLCPRFSPPASCFKPSSPFLSSYVDEIRWFLLGEASVHPSAAPSCACPTPNTQVITKPANSHTSSITAASFPLLPFCVHPCPWTAPSELTAGQHTDRLTLHSRSLSQEKRGLSQNVCREVPDLSEGHTAV